MKGRYKINDRRGRRGEPDSSPLLGDPAAGSPVPGAAVCGVGGTKKGKKDVLSLRKMLGEHLLLKDSQLLYFYKNGAGFFSFCLFFSSK